jgi:hypothetical protein
VNFAARIMADQGFDPATNRSSNGRSPAFIGKLLSSAPFGGGAKWNIAETLRRGQLHRRRRFNSGCGRFDFMLTGHASRPARALGPEGRAATGARRRFMM